jgi:tellurite resistance protein TerC
MNTLWMWLGFNLFVLLLLALDLGLLHRKSQEVGIREALLLSLGYFVLALLFGAGVFHFLGASAGYEFFTGYLIEKSLSVDNIFVFVLIFRFLRVPAQYQHRVLFWGILGRPGHARYADRGRRRRHPGLPLGNLPVRGVFGLYRDQDADHH